MAIASGLIREVVEPYFWYIQRAISATRIARVTWIEITYKSRVILQEINCRKLFIGLSGRTTNTTVRKYYLSLLNSLGVRSTFRTSTKVCTPRITVVPVTLLTSPILDNWVTLLRDAIPRLIPKVCELCTEVGRAW